MPIKEVSPDLAFAIEHLDRASQIHGRGGRKRHPKRDRAEEIADRFIRRNRNVYVAHLRDSLIAELLRVMDECEREPLDLLDKFILPSTFSGYASYAKLSALIEKAQRLLAARRTR